MVIINILLLLAAFLSFSGTFTLSSPYPAIGLYYYVFLYLPGYYVIRWFFNDAEIDGLEMVPLSLCGGFIFIFPWALAAFFLKMPLLTFSFLYLCVVALWFAAYGLYVRKTHPAKLRKVGLGSTPWLILACILAASFLMADFYGGFVSGNFLPIVSGLRKMVDFGRIEQISPFFKGISYSPAMYQSTTVLLSMIMALSRHDPVTIWIYLPQFILPVGLIANFCLARRLFKNDAAALVYLGIFFLYYCLFNARPPGDGYAWLHSEFSACYNFLAMGVFLPCIFLVVLQYMSSDNKKLLYLLPLLFLGQGSAHLYVQSKTYFMLYTLTLWSVALKPEFIDYRKLRTAAAYASIGLIYFFCLSLMLLRPNINPYYKSFSVGGGYPVTFFGK